MAVFVRTSDSTNTTDASQIDTLATGDDLIVTRKATLLATGVGSVVVRASTANDMTLNGELLSAERVILSDGGFHDISVGVDGVLSAATSFSAIDLGAGGNVIANAGAIEAGASAIAINGGFNEITNTGLLTGASGVIDIAEGDNVIVNHGTIVGTGLGADGIFIVEGNNVIHNTGTITGFNDDGVQINSSVGEINTLINSGTISTTTEFGFAYNGGDANDTVTNTGSMIGGIDFGAGSDLLDTRRGTLDGEVFGGDGNDVLRGSAFDDSFFGENDNDLLEGFVGDDALNGGAGNDILNGGLGLDDFLGGAGNDFASYARAAAGVTVSLANAAQNTGEAAGDSFVGIESLLGSRHNDRLIGDAAGNGLNGGLGDDTLSGGQGNDNLVGGAGADDLTGGLGLDSFSFVAALGGGNVDVMNDFVVADDTIRLSSAVFDGLAAGALPAGAFQIGAAATQADDRIVYNNVTGALIFDSNGSAAGGAVQFATLDPGLALTAADFGVI